MVTVTWVGWGSVRISSSCISDDSRLPHPGDKPTANFLVLGCEDLSSHLRLRHCQLYEQARTSRISSSSENLRNNLAIWDLSQLSVIFPNFGLMFEAISGLLLTEARTRVAVLCWGVRCRALEGWDLCGMARNAFPMSSGVVLDYLVNQIIGGCYG